MPNDPWSKVLKRLRLSAKVDLRADFCGCWGVDTSGSRRAPFHLLTRGTGWLHQPGKDPVQLTPGDLVIFPRDSRHVLANSAELPGHTDMRLDQGEEPPGPVTGLMCGYFSFDRQAAAPLLDGLPESIVLDLRDTARHHDTAALIQLWLSEASGGAPGSEAVIDRLAYVVFVHVLRDQMEKGQIKGPLEALADPRIGPALAQIHEDPGDSHSVENLAAAAGLSRSAFSGEFSRLVGMSPAKYVHFWRMQHAAEMLTETRLSLAHIAERSGYSSEVAFRKAFRQHMGVPPGRWRQPVADNNNDLDFIFL